MPHEIVPVEDDELGKLLHKTFALPIRKRYIKVDGVVLPEHFKYFAERIENFNIRDDDVWVCSFPKTGTTWTQEMAWTILYDVDSEAAKVPLTDRVPYFEISQFLDYTEETPPTDLIEFPEYAIDSVDFVDKFPSPRIIKSHLPLHILPRQLRNGETKAKIIYVNRNAKDTCISYYHHARLLEGYHGTFDELCTLFLGDTVHHGPFWAHVLAFWKKRNDENVLFLKFEDLKANLSQEIEKTAKFLGKNLTTEQLSRLTTHLSFANMKNNPAANNENLVALAQVVMPTDSKGKFMRVGDTKQWKAVMTPEFIEKFDNWTRRWLNDSDLYDSK